MSVVCVIPARAGSKSLPNKNLRTVGGISLVGRAVLTAHDFIRQAGLSDVTILVDTDGDAIAEEGLRWGATVPFLRPTELAGDAVSTVASSLVALERMERAGVTPHTLLLLQPTSPLRSAADVLECWRLYDASARPSVISVVGTDHPTSLSFNLDSAGRIQWILNEPSGQRRQDYSPTYWASGAVYIASVGFLRQRKSFLVPGSTVGVAMPRLRSVDIDTEEDLALAESLLGARPPETISLGSRVIGSGCKCFVIAEAGVNHNGDPAIAHQLIEIAASAGADAVKFQTFDAEELAATNAPKADYQMTWTGAGESQLDMLRQLTLPRDVLAELAAHAADRGIVFLSTAFDAGNADFLDALGVPAFKVPSGELTNYSFLAHLGSKGKPLLVSTGMSTITEVAQAVEVLRANGAPPMALFHCVSDYPAAPSDCNLRAIESMRRAFGVPVGWSDHTNGIGMGIAAVAAGASLIEKHFTLHRDSPGPDHRASLEPGELTAFVDAIRQTDTAMGDGQKRPVAAERAIAAVARRSMHAARSLPAGHVLEDSDLVALRPGTGISPALRERLLGRALRVDMSRGEMLQEQYLA